MGSTEAAAYLGDVQAGAAKAAGGKVYFVSQECTGGNIYT